jgi:hypothetical protein
MAKRKVMKTAAELINRELSGERFTRNHSALYLNVTTAIADSKVSVANGTTLLRSTTIDFILSMGRS